MAKSPSTRHPEPASGRAKDLSIMEGYVYILTNWNNKVLYIGVTNNLCRRIKEHRDKKISGFTSRYNLTKLVYYIGGDSIGAAIEHEKRLKGWTRKKKNALIESTNPDWKDLYLDLS